MSTLAFSLDPVLSQQLATLNATQLAWLSGYCWAQSQTLPITVGNEANAQAQPTTASTQPITILSASQTGNARRVAEALLQQLLTLGLNAQLSDVADYKHKHLSQETTLLLVTSTQGEGEPPEEAIPLHAFLFGKKAPNLSQLHYAVLALGDRSYPDFCQAGKDFDQQLAQLGATRLSPRRDCDLDHETEAAEWRTHISQILTERAAVNTTAQSTDSIPQTDVIQGQATSTYTKETPYGANLSIRQKITASHAAKDIQHLEIDLGDSGLTYLPGDALGVWPTNDAALVDAILTAARIQGDQLVTLAEGQTLPIRTLLSHHVEVTQSTPQFIKGYAALGPVPSLLALAEDPKQLSEFSRNTSILSVLHAHPLPEGHLDAQALHGLLRPLTPRLYSIASSQAEVDNEVHLTVAVPRYEQEGGTFTGTASGFLGQRLQEDESVRVFIEPNRHFRLPNNPDTDIIMIGAGTGIAPYRAFMQQRENDEATGKNWLIFGNQRFIDDFLYQTEWQQWHKQGLLHQVSLAWSRQDPQQKVYVQDRLRQSADQLWQWLQNGAHVYVCGDANHMARDVEATLLHIIAEKGQLDAEAAKEYLNELRVQSRYQRDVY